MNEDEKQEKLNETGEKKVKGYILHWEQIERIITTLSYNNTKIVLVLAKHEEAKIERIETDARTAEGRPHFLITLTHRTGEAQMRWLTHDLNKEEQTVLSTLDQAADMDIDEISEKTGLGTDQIYKDIAAMLKLGDVKEVVGVVPKRYEAW